MAKRRSSPTPACLPRWRGFNLLEKFSVARPECNTAFREEDFELITALGFDFVRLPLDYRTWTDDTDPFRLDEKVLTEIDQAVEWGAQYRLHVDINLHRAPGYCVNAPAEPTDLWSDERTQEICGFYWASLAERYRGMPNERLSFNLVNEPKNIDELAYVRVVEKLSSAIRDVDEERLLIADGLDLGWTPVHGLARLQLAQSLHAYDPWGVSHYRAAWFPGADTWDEPTWPLRMHGRVRDRETLRAERIEPWLALGQAGVGIHVGEFGTFNMTPHAVTLAWMEDFLQLFGEVGWGWCLWNLRGSYGPLDSGRADVAYEDFRGHLLDREMLELLLRY